MYDPYYGASVSNGRAAGLRRPGEGTGTRQTGIMNKLWLPFSRMYFTLCTAPYPKNTVLKYSACGEDKT